ncbi:hypothetical protein BT93_D0974 [Corymbia citriodora subsp. variegata]|nr:hypothetical protein BT93_D0974 [Corymbia citriodora subsp. variegata]
MAPQHYDVFLSYGEGDSQTGFNDFLYNSLVAAGVHVFRHDDALPAGKQIGPEILWAIRSCRIAIPVISEQYAQSNWCLSELTEIMDCHRHYGKLVFPIFYKLNVLDVRDRVGIFADALRTLEKQHSSEETQKWQEVMASAARIKGWISNTIRNGHEGELVKMVVERILSKLKTTWIERLPMSPILMSNYYIRSVHHCFLQKTRSESKCQVFVAFRGPDTRFGLAAYLCISLEAAGIRVFDDNDPLLIGTDIDNEIYNAIDCCKIAIPILSKNYAASVWCLNELDQMVECKRRKGLKILPIFYKVEPSQVQELSHSFQEDMCKHKKQVDGYTYERWERALREVGSSSNGLISEKISNGYLLSPFPTKNFNLILLSETSYTTSSLLQFYLAIDRHEGVLVKRVVKDISRLLNNPQTSPIPKLFSRL